MVSMNEAPVSCVSSFRTLRSRKQSSSNFLLLSINEVDTPKKALSFSASTPVNNIQENYIASDASLLTPIADQSPLRQRTITTTTTTATLDGFRGQFLLIPVTNGTNSTGNGPNVNECDGEPCFALTARNPSSDHTTSVNGDATVSKTHTSLANGYTCTDCLFHPHRKESFTTHSSSFAAQPAEAPPNALSPSSVSRFTSIYSRERSRKGKTGTTGLWLLSHSVIQTRRWKSNPNVPSMELNVVFLFRCLDVCIEYVFALQQTSSGPHRVLRHLVVQQRALAGFFGQKLTRER